jgi:hypothetical protein
MAFSSLLADVARVFEAIGATVLVVVIRPFLSVSLQVEIDGQLPWRRLMAAGDAAGSGTTDSNRLPAEKNEARQGR